MCSAELMLILLRAFLLTHEFSMLISPLNGFSAPAIVQTSSKSGTWGSIEVNLDPRVAKNSKRNDVLIREMNSLILKKWEGAIDSSWTAADS